MTKNKKNADHFNDPTSFHAPLNRFWKWYKLKATTTFQTECKRRPQLKNRIKMSAQPRNNKFLRKWTRQQQQRQREQMPTKPPVWTLRWYLSTWQHLADQCWCLWQSSNQYWLGGLLNHSRRLLRCCLRRFQQQCWECRSARHSQRRICRVRGSSLWRRGGWWHRPFQPGNACL